MQTKTEIVERKEHFLMVMNEVIADIQKCKVNEEQKRRQQKAIDVIHKYINKPIYNGIYVDRLRNRTLKKAVARILEYLTKDFYQPMSTDNSIFVRVYLGVPYWSHEIKNEQLTLF